MEVLAADVVSYSLSKLGEIGPIANKFTRQAQQSKVGYNDARAAGQADIGDIEFRAFALMGISCSDLKRRTADERTVE